MAGYTLFTILYQKGGGLTQQGDGARNPDLFLFVLILGILMMFLAAGIVTRISSHITKEFELDEGQYRWTVYTDGEYGEWLLSYALYGDLPFSSNNYNDVVVYRGIRYKLMRVYPGQLQVSRIKD